MLCTLPYDKFKARDLSFKKSPYNPGKKIRYINDKLCNKVFAQVVLVSCHTSLFIEQK